MVFVDVLFTLSEGSFFSSHCRRAGSEGPMCGPQLKGPGVAAGEFQESSRRVQSSIQPCPEGCPPHCLSVQFSVSSDGTEAHSTPRKGTEPVFSAWDSST